MQFTTKNSNEIQEISTSMKELKTASKEVTTSISTITDSPTEIEALNIETSEISNQIKDTLLEKQKLIKDLNNTVNSLKQDLDFFKIN
jgi:methyl-accepting chemotaxis protein